MGSGGRGGCSLKHAETEFTKPPSWLPGRAALLDRLIIVVALAAFICLATLIAIPSIRLEQQRNEVAQNLAAAILVGMSRQEAEARMERLGYNINYDGSDDRRVAGYSCLEPKRLILVPFGEHQVVVRVNMIGERVDNWRASVEPNK